MENIDVVKSFVSGKNYLRSNTSLVLLSGCLYSYNILFAKRDGDKIIINSKLRGFSKTSTTHFNMVLNECEEQGVNYEIKEL